MTKIKNKKEYQALCSRIDELLKIVGNDTPPENVDFIELNIISDIVADYEETYMPISKPSLADTIKLRMFEQGLNQKKLAELLGISTSRVSEYLNGKSEPTLKVARIISNKLNIEPAIILGV